MERGQGDEKATEYLAMRATKSQHDAVLRRASAERRSVSEWLRLRLERCLAEEAEPPVTTHQPPRGHR